MAHVIEAGMQPHEVEQARGEHVATFKGKMQAALITLGPSWITVLLADPPLASGV